jgi:hypothetical protein
MVVDAGMVVALILIALAIGGIAAAEVHSRRQKRLGKSGELSTGQAAKPTR